MIQGRIDRDLIPTLTLRVLGEDDAQEQVLVMLDTGFNGDLKLPPAIIKSLALPFVQDVFVRLADGRPATMPVYQGSVEWGETTRSALVLEAPGVPLAGMSLFVSCRATLDIEMDGRIRIEELPSSVEHGH